MNKVSIALGLIILLANITYGTNDDWMDKYYNLDDKTPEELRLLRNEIYARHGRIFKSKDLEEYFSKQPWYKPNSDYHDSLLSPTEIRLINFITNIKEDLKPIAKYLNLGYFHRTSRILYRKEFKEKDLKVEIKVVGIGRVGEYCCNIYIYENDRLIYRTYIGAICYEFEGDIRLIELGKNKYGLELTYIFELPQEGDFSSPHRKSKEYLFFIRTGNTFKKVIKTPIYYESVPFDEYQNADYSRATIIKKIVEYRDMDWDDTKDLWIKYEGSIKPDIVIYLK